MDSIAKLREQNVEDLTVEDFIYANGRRLQESDKDELQLFEGLKENEVHELQEIAEKYLDLFEETGGFKYYDDEQY